MKIITIPKQFFLFIVMFCFTLTLTSFAFSNKLKKSKPTKSSPNIIYIMCDDLTIQAISVYQGIYKNIAPTNNIDRLAREGMLFQNALCTNSICGPSRAAILTGKYSHVNKYYKNEGGGKFDSTQWTFPQEFKKNGYQTALFGKWHLGTEPKGFDVFKYHYASEQQGVYWNPSYNENGKIIQEKGYATNITTNFVLNWLDKERVKEDPFLILLQYKAPHRPWDTDSIYTALWNDIEMPYPSTFNDDYKGRELTAGNTEMTMDFFSRRDMKMKMPTDLVPTEKLEWESYGVKKNQIVQPEGMTIEQGKKWRYQNYIKDYLACVKSVDDNLGRLFYYLDKNNLMDNTIIILTSDQGFYLGDHGFFDKRFIYEESLHMPFLVRYPKLIKPNTVNADIITNIDFAPTLLELANIKTDEKMQGKSFVPILLGNTPKNWDTSMYYHYYEFPCWHHVEPHYGIRTKRYTLAHFYYDIDVWELYDLEIDPKQLHNVINEPQYANTIVQLRKQLTTLMKQYGNNKPLAEFRKITDTNSGSLMDIKDDETYSPERLNSEKNTQLIVPNIPK